MIKTNLQLVSNQLGTTKPPQSLEEQINLRESQKLKAADDSDIRLNRSDKAAQLVSGATGGLNLKRQASGNLQDLKKVQR